MHGWRVESVILVYDQGAREKGVMMVLVRNVQNQRSLFSYIYLKCHLLYI